MVGIESALARHLDEVGRSRNRFEQLERLRPRQTHDTGVAHLETMPSTRVPAAITNPGEGVEEWLELVDRALQGLHHALNNRIGSLSALVELYQAGGTPPEGVGLDGLTADITRLGECNRIIRLLPRDASAGEESLILDDVLADVLAIHRYLHDARDVPVTIVPTRYVEPVRLERWAAVRVLTLLLADAKRLAQAENAAVRAITESDDKWVRVEFRVGSPVVEQTPASGGGPYAELVALGFGGTVTRKPGTVELTLPTLKARRAADRR
jgi:hypothetical protein